MDYIVNHEDISIESAYALGWSQKFDTTLNYEDLYINSEEYTDYQPTRLQFHLASATVTQPIKVKIPYANRLTRTHVKHAAICKYDPAKKQWIIVKHTLNAKDSTLEFESNTIGIYCVFINHYWYTSITQRMADEYPNWTKIRQSNKSVGQQFLNYFGIELETLHDYLEWIQEQKYIQTVDLTSLDWVYMYQLPEVRITDTVEVLRAISSGFQRIQVLDSIKDFFYNDQNNGGIIDYKESKFYTTKKYGNLILNITRDGVKTSHAIAPMDYHIWNSLDEFGILLGVARLYLEKNVDFKERILDVFRYPAGTHDIGLTNGIARDLNLIQRKDRFGKTLIWSDDKKDLLLRNTEKKVIDYRTIRIDDKPLKENQYTVDEVGNIRVYAFNTGEKHTISFICGIEKYQLYDKDEEALRKMMFQVDGQATPTLLTWVEYINTVAPIMWGRFNWDEGFWDTIDKQLTGLGYVPNIWDSDIEVWKDYVFDSDK